MLAKHMIACKMPYIFFNDNFRQILYTTKHKLLALSIQIKLSQKLCLAFNRIISIVIPQKLFEIHTIPCIIRIILFIIRDLKCV